MNTAKEHRWLTRLGLATLASLLSLCLLEGLTRATLNEELSASRPPPPSPTPWGATLTGNPYLLWEYTPGIREEAGVSVQINSLGFRGREQASTKASGVRRIMAIGDSSVYGFGVADDEVFLNRIVDRLGGPSAPVEAINAAVPGYSTYQSINLLEMRALALKPDVLIVGNLWSDNNFDTFVDRDLLDAYSRFEQGLAARVHHLLEPLAVYRLIDYSLRVKRGRQAVAREVGWTVGNEGGTEGTRRVAINDYARNLDRLVDLAHDTECEVIFLVLAHPFDLEPATGGEPAWRIYRKAMRDTASRHGLPLVDMPRIFASSQFDTTLLFSDALHPTALGHTLMAEAIAEILEPWTLGASIEKAGDANPRPTYNDAFATTKSRH